VKVDTRFPIRVVTIFVVGIALTLAVLLISGQQEFILPAVAGAVLSLANVLAGFWALEYSLGKSFTTLLKTVLGGMGIRLLVMLGVLVLLIKVVHLHAVTLVVSLLTFYVVYLILEVLYIQERVSHK
jgi:hypothetical protein